MNDNEDNIVLNDRAVSVMQRMNDKLNGKDGLIESGVTVDTGDSVEHQVRRLIEKAMNHENLCTSYIDGVLSGNIVFSFVCKVCTRINRF